MTGESVTPRPRGFLTGWWQACGSLVTLSIFVVAVVDGYAVWFVASETTLYHADQVTYWSYSRQLAQLLVVDPVGAVQAVARTVANNDVNLLPAVPVALVMTIFGGSRLVYILAVITVYGLATVIMLGLALRRFGVANSNWVAALVFLLVPTIWRPVFIGYLGIGGVALGLAVLALVVPSVGSSWSPRTMALAGVVLAVLVLFRRWWGIWAAAFCVVMVLVAVRDLMAARPRSVRAFVKVVKGPLVLGAAACGTLIVFAAPILVTRFQTDYSDRFAAYSLDGWPQRIAAVIDHLGVFGVMLIVGSFTYLVAGRVFRRGAVVLSLLAVVTYGLMVSIQDHSPQHWYLYDPSILLLVGLAVGRLGEVFPPRLRPAVWVPVLLLGITMTTAVFIPDVLGGRGGRLLPSDGIRPQVRDDLTEVDRLLTYLDHRYQGGPGVVYVLASSGLLSDHILGFSNLSLGRTHPSVKGFLASAHVDRRDGFPRGLMVAEAVIVADPVQLHLPADEQRVVAEPAQSFLKGTDIAQAFRELPVTFTLDGGVRVHVFERMRPITARDLEGLSSRLRDAYPDRPEIFAP